jgi:hypothetical protein
MPTIARTAIVLFLAVLLAGCSDILGPDYLDYIMPLKVGNRWIYWHTGMDSIYRDGALDTLEIVGTEIVKGETWFISNRGERYINRARGLHVRDSNSTCGCMRAKYPATTGDLFQFDTARVLLPGNNDPVRQVTAREVVSTDTIITVRGTKYYAHLFRPKLFEPTNARFVYDSYDYFVVNLGPILFNIGTDHYELVRAELK